MPGMTATVSVVVNRRDDVLRIPAAALRFRPEGFDPASARRERPAGGAGSPGAGPGGGGRRVVVFTPDPKGEPQPVRIRQGISDGQFVEVVDGLDEGAAVITGVASGDAAAGRPGRAGASPASNPFQPQRPQRRTR
jgi:HlyD family secretion protein